MRCSVRPDVILLLDTFFHVLIFHGETIAAWRDQGYQDLPEHAAFRTLLQAPKDDASAVMENRMPVPRYIVCDQNKSQARFLMAKLNPSVTHNNMDTSGAAPVFTGEQRGVVCSSSLSHTPAPVACPRTAFIVRIVCPYLCPYPTRADDVSYSVFSEHLCKLSVSS